MSEFEARDPVLLRSYEGLVFTTAAMLVADLRWKGIATPDDDLDDLMQLLRVKVFRSLQRFDSARMPRKRAESAAQARDRYVFMCLRDTAKDIAKKKRRPTLMIEDVAPASDAGPRDSFDFRYLAQTEEQTYATVEAVLPLIPNTLNELERGVLVLLYRDYTHREIALRLGISKGEVSSAVRALRAKLGDWRPGFHPDPVETPSPAVSRVA